MNRLSIGDQIIITKFSWNEDSPFTIGNTYSIIGVDENPYSYLLNRYLIRNDSNTGHTWLYRSQFMEEAEYRQFILHQIITS